MDGPRHILPSTGADRSQREEGLRSVPRAGGVSRVRDRQSDRGRDLGGNKRPGENSGEGEKIGVTVSGVRDGLWERGWVLDERWTKIIGRRVWRDLSGGETAIEP